MPARCKVTFPISETGCMASGRSTVEFEDDEQPASNSEAAPISRIVFAIVGSFNSVRFRRHKRHENRSSDIVYSASRGSDMQIDTPCRRLPNILRARLRKSFDYHCWRISSVRHRMEDRGDPPRGCPNSIRDHTNRHTIRRRSRACHIDQTHSVLYEPIVAVRRRYGPVLTSPTGNLPLKLAWLDVNVSPKWECGRCSGATSVFPFRFRW